MSNKRESNWWEEQDGFFGPEYLRQYEGTILTLKESVRQVDFIKRALGLTPENPQRILDVPCGHGRHAYHLRNDHHDYTGVDLNQHFLETARRQWSADYMRFIQADMRELDFHGEFDLVLNLFTAMGYFEDDKDDERFFAGVFRALKPGGKFLVDYLNRDRLLREFQPRDWRKLPDGSIVITERQYDILSGRMHDKRITIKDGEVRREVTSSIRFYSPHELITMAQRVGFLFEIAYGDFTEQELGEKKLASEPLTINSPRSILVFQRPE